MYTIYDLFAYRSVVGRKLEQLIEARNCTKSKICAKAGISRPTLDKLLKGEVTNKTNFEKHLLKLLALLELTPNEFMGGIAHPYANQKQLRKAFDIDLGRLSQMSGISVETLKKVEAGESIPLADLRDIAFCLAVGVSDILGDRYFPTQVSCVDDFVKSDSATAPSPSGFGGHLGLLVKGQPKFLWFPITMYTRNLLSCTDRRDYLAVPCMDNSLLLINFGNIEELVLLDDACDQPVDMDWDYTVSCGEIPAVIYEAFDDYMGYKNSNDTPAAYDLSESLVSAIDELVAQQKLDPEVFASQLYSMTVMFRSGRTMEHCIFRGDNDSFIPSIRSIYETGELFMENTMTFEDENEAEILINLENISMIRLPLSKVDSMIIEDIKATMAEMED